MKHWLGKLLRLAKRLNRTRWQMNRARLNTNPSSYYAAKFSVEKIEIVPYRAAGQYQFIDGDWKPVDSAPGFPVHYLHEQLEQGMVTITGPIEFEIYMPAKNGHVKNCHIEMARLVLNQIVEMDAEARSHVDDKGYEEDLVYVEIEAQDDTIHLHYVANTVNTEWGAYFSMQPNGVWQWISLG